MKRKLKFYTRNAVSARREAKEMAIKLCQILIRVSFVLNGLHRVKVAIIGRFITPRPAHNVFYPSDVL